MTEAHAAGTRDPLHISAALALVVVLLANRGFWTRVLDHPAASPLSQLSFVALAGLALFALSWLPLLWLATPRTARVGWSLWLLLAAVSAYFIDRYGLVIDRIAIQSVIETDLREASEWLSVGMFGHLAVAALMIAAVWRLRLCWPSPARHARRMLGATALASALLAVSLALAYRPLATLARNHRELGHLMAPWNVVEGLVSYLRVSVDPRPTHATPVGIDAQRGPSWAAGDPPRLLVLVIGESARASSFGVLGYARETTPQLARRNVIAYGHVDACGTSTAVSLPCMLSDLGRAAFSDRKARGRESVIDVVAHAGLAAVWFDNNTGSKGAAHRIEEISVAAGGAPAWCTPAGCQDEVLVERMRQWLGENADASGIVVLHQKGSHGPSYFERYPSAFRRFVPTCDDSNLARCTLEAIRNTYDNSILYTDHVLARVIEALEADPSGRDSAMLYISDHGESTGEGGVYLHGAPRMIAPDEQRRVPLLVWLSEGYRRHRGVDASCLRARRGQALSHDNVFDSVLGLLDVGSRAYRPALDLFAGCASAPQAGERTRIAQSKASPKMRSSSGTSAKPPPAASARPDVSSGASR